MQTFMQTSGLTPSSSALFFHTVHFLSMHFSELTAAAQIDARACHCTLNHRADSKRESHNHSCYS